MCEVSIKSIFGIVDLSGNLEAIQASGTATPEDCLGVTVTLTCGGIPLTKSVPVDKALGLWVAVFTLADGLALTLCHCDTTRTVKAVCEGPASLITSCFDELSGPLECKPLHSVCPATHPKPPVIGECNADGTRPVTFQATLTQPGTFIAATLMFNNVTLDTASGMDTIELGPVTVNISPGMAAAVMHFLTPFGCNNHDIPVNVPDCPGIVGACCFGGAASQKQCKDGITKSECDQLGGEFFPGKACKEIDCVPLPIEDDDPVEDDEERGKGSCGGLVWVAVLLLAGGLLALAFHLCMPVPQAQSAVYAGGWVLVGLYALLMGIAFFSGLFGTCNLDSCEIAKIHMLVLSPIAAVLGLLKGLAEIENPNLAFLDWFVCLWPFVFYMFAIELGIWGTVLANCQDD